MPRCCWLLAIALVVSGGLRPPLASADEPLRAVIDREVSAAWAAQKVAPVREVLRRRVPPPRLHRPRRHPAHPRRNHQVPRGYRREEAGGSSSTLCSPTREFATAQANTWDLALFGRSPGNASDTRVRPAFKAWLTKQFADGTAYDKWVKELLLAEQPGSEMFMVQFRSAPDEATVAVTRIFLGTQLQCAKCHDHPFDAWTQKDFYGMSGFFVRLVVQEAASGNTRTFSIGEKGSGEVLFAGNAKEQKPGQKGDPIKPKFLGGTALDEPPLPKDYKEPPYPKTGEKLPKPAFSRKEKLAAWVTAPDNPYFARAAVNRVWAQLMGRGIVHPIDDFNKENEPSHPALLKALADGFVAHKYDLKWLLREIANSDAYQLSGAGGSKEALPPWFERARVRPLTAEEVFEAMRTATGVEVEPEGPDRGVGLLPPRLRRADQRPGRVPGEPERAPVPEQRGPRPRVRPPQEGEPRRTRCSRPRTRGRSGSSGCT